MNADGIVIQESGVSILGFPVGLKPHAKDFELALQDQTLRRRGTTSERRELWICDGKGLSWLVDLRLGTVLWLDIALGPVRHRKKSESDPSSLFEGKVRIAGYTIQGCFSVETGEIVRKVSVPGLTLDLSAAGQTVRGVTIGFAENEI